MRTIARRVQNRALERFRRHRFQKLASHVHSTSPSQYESDENVVIVTQLHKAALEMGLLALKSFMMNFGRGTLEIINDGSLDEADLATLQRHLPGCTVIPIEEVERQGCPSGACWERLCYIIQRSADAYVIQVDTDTLTLGPINEVYDAVKKNSSFTIGDPRWRDRIDADYLAQVMHPQFRHVQAKCEHLLNEWPGFNNNSAGYLRGCAAFTGFARGKYSMQALTDLSTWYENRMGWNAWNQWGSEQFASNVMVSMENSSTLLPWPKYLNNGLPEYAGSYEGIVSVAHFIGSKRFASNRYKEEAAKVLRSLR